MKHLLQILLPLLSLLFSGCASTFKSIDPQKIPFNYVENTPDVQFSYAYDVLSIRGNKKYVKKEMKHGMRVVAVKITNNTQQTLELNKNLKLVVGNNQTTPVEPTIVTNNLKQDTWMYLLYTPVALTFGATTTNNYGQVESQGGTILPVGPLLAAGNILIALDANKNFRKELTKFNLLDKKIEPGQTVYGLITLHSLTAEPIKFEVQ